MKAIFLLCAAIALLTCTSLGPVGAVDAPSVVLVRVPDHGIQPEAIVDPGGMLHLLYFVGEPGGGDLYYVRSKDYGQTFSTPVRVNSQPGSALATGTVRGGQLAIGRGGRVYVGWAGSNRATPRGFVNPANGQASGPYLYARSNEEATAFEPQRNLAKRTYGLDGGSIAADTSGHVYAAWHALAAGGGTGEEHRRVWIARSADEGVTFTDEQPAWSEPTGACGCCGLRMSSTPSDILYLLYRAAAGMTHRDIYLLESTDSARSFRGSRVQRWEIAACPMTSMSIAATSSNAFGAWETAGQVYFGAIDSKAAAIPTPIPAPGAGGTRKHPRLATNANGDVLVVWTEGTAWARGGSLSWQLFDPSGRATSVKGAAPDVPVWSFAAPIARTDGRFVVLY